MIPESEIPDDDDMLDAIDTSMEASPLHRIPKKLKYKDKGFQIQRTLDGQKWTLVCFYRSAEDMRKSYAARLDGWGRDHYRMIFPDGSIVPKCYGDGPGRFGHGFYESR
jgi:hypothetical protein